MYKGKIDMSKYNYQQIAAKAEQEDNVAEQKRQLGKKVLYGQVIQVSRSATDVYHFFIILY